MHIPACDMLYPRILTVFDAWFPGGMRGTLPRQFVMEMPQFFVSGWQ